MMQHCNPWSSHRQWIGCSGSGLWSTARLADAIDEMTGGLQSRFWLPATFARSRHSYNDL